MDHIDLTHLKDADLYELEILLKDAENNGGFSDRINTNYPNKATYDVKFAYHLVRLLNEVEQILVEGDLDLQRNREQLKEIRRGEWSLEQLESYFENKERALESVYATSTLPHSPDEGKIKTVLLQCLEEHYGDLSNAVKRDVNVEGLIRDLKTVMDRYAV